MTSDRSDAPKVERRLTDVDDPELRPSGHHRSREWFSVAAHVVAGTAGSAWTSGISIVVVLGLLVAGVLDRFPVWWQIVVYSSGALVSLLVLVSIQHTTNRQTQAILLKLDELIRVTGDADDDVIAVETRRLHEQEHVHRQRHGPGSRL